MKAPTMDLFASFRSLSRPLFSPEGTAACFAVTKGDMKKNSYSSCLWLRRDGKLRQLTAGGKESSFVWLDEHTILFPADREEEKDGVSSRWYAISTEGGEAAPYLRFPIPTSELIPLKNGDFLVVGRVFPGYEELYRGDERLRRQYLTDREAEADYEVVTRNPWWFNGTTFIRGAYSALYLCRGRKHELTQLSPAGFDVSEVTLSPDGGSVYYSLRDALSPRSSGMEGLNIYRTDLCTGETERVLESGRTRLIEAFWPCDSFLLLKISDAHCGKNTDGDFYTMDYGAGEPTLLCPWGRSLGSSVGSDLRHGGGQVAKAVGDTLYFISTVWDSGRLYMLRDGSISCLTEREGSVDSFDVCAGQLLCVAMWDMRGQELYDEKGKRLSSFNTAVLRGTYTAIPEPLNFVSRGEEIHGFVLKPMDFDPEKKYPVILDIHGGPKTVFGAVYYHEMQLWAGKGYFVIFCNPAGSDGRGDFMDIMGKYGTIDYEDLMNFCDAALAAYPQMDADNFFETGGSYGGYMTNWIIGHTDRFRAVASQRSISNWISFYGISDIGMVFSPDQNLADIWPDADRLWDRSPLKYADRAKTPTLFIHSFEDYRCPIDQGYQMFTALLEHGVETKMVLFRGENHELSRSGKPEHRLRRLREITDWFETHRG